VASRSLSSHLNIYFLRTWQIPGMGLGEKRRKVSSASNLPQRVDEDGQLTPGRDLPVEGDSNRKI
jgi:hypothetical protein